MKLDDDDFKLFELPARQQQNRAHIDERWRALQGEVHPDRFAAEGAAAQRVAMQWAVRVNEAYRRLKDPLQRAAYLCELRGVPIDAEHNTAMPPAFLMQQMEWREELDDAGTLEGLEALLAQVNEHERDQLSKIGQSIDGAKDFNAAAQQVRSLMFMQRFAGEVDARIDQLGQ